MHQDTRDEVQTLCHQLAREGKLDVAIVCSILMENDINATSDDIALKTISRRVGKLFVRLGARTISPQVKYKMDKLILTLVHAHGKPRHYSNITFYEKGSWADDKVRDTAVSVPAG